MRSIFSQAIKSGLVDQMYYPFGSGKIKIKFPESVKIGLTIEEVKKLEDANLSEYPKLAHACNLWLLSFYFVGMRVSDLLRLRWSDFSDSRLFYTMGKNSKSGSLKVPEKAETILAKYKLMPKNRYDLVFHHLGDVKSMDNTYEVQKKISYVVKTLDEALIQLASMLGIKKKLTMHIARHTFGNISGDKIPIQMLQKLYRHTSITTTIGYQANFINKDTDEALEAVIKF